MTDVLGFAAYLLLPLIGIAVWRLDGVRKLALDGRIAIAGAAGALIFGVAMAVMPVVGLTWSRTRLFVVFGLIAVIGFRVARVGAGFSRHRPAEAGLYTKLALLLVFAITAYALLTARATCGDLLFFWGPKGVHFFRAGKIDLAYLADWSNVMAHRDYPPLLPLLYAWSHTVSAQFSWWAAVLFSGLCLAGIVAIVRAGGRSDVVALLAAAALSCAFISARVAGAADPLLLFFEATTAAALTFMDDARSQWIVAAIGVAGAVLTKVEGLGFAVAVLLTVLLVKPRTIARAAIVVPGALLIGAWLLVMAHHGMLAEYLSHGPIHIEYLPRVLTSTVRTASMETLWIPWIAPALVMMLGDVRRARVPLLLGALTFGAAIFFYLHGPEDPTSWWIRASAPRVLLTPLVMLVMAASAATGERTPCPAVILTLSEAKGKDLVHSGGDPSPSPRLRNTKR
jgi:hypothetical protein